MAVQQDFRSHFPLIQKPPYQPFIYADSAASTQKPQEVLDKLQQFYSTQVANIHRGAYRLSEQASFSYEQSRRAIAQRFGAQQCIFTRGATEGLNLLAHGLDSRLQNGDHLLLSIAEHHANIVCWQQLAQKKDLTLHFAPLDYEGCIDVEYCLNLLDQYPIKVVSLVHVSNTLGTIQPLEPIFKKAHEKGAVTIADCCQSMPFYLTTLEELDADFVVFSGHKIFAPSGIGALLARHNSLLDEFEPYQTGGGMISQVSTSHTSFASSPTRFEAGTPFIEGAVMLHEAFKFIDKFSVDQLKSHLESLTQQAQDSFSQVDSMKTFFLHNKSRAPIFSVVFDDIHAHDLATFLDTKGLCVRSGHHCTMPLIRTLGNVHATTRLSFHLYNTLEEVQRCAQLLNEARNFFHAR